MKSRRRNILRGVLDDIEGDLTVKEHFIKARDNLKEMVAELAVKVEAALESAIRAVESGDVERAGEIIVHDREIDLEEVKIEEECLKILALYQPVASDLREVITILKINNELERVGDLSCSIADRAADMASYRDKVEEKFDFSEMMRIAREMLKESLDALIYRDSVTAGEVILTDDAMDNIHRRSYDIVKAMILKYPELINYYLDCLTVSRCLERVADSATNICEDIIYLEHGRIIRHTKNTQTQE